MSRTIQAVLSLAVVAGVSLATQAASAQVPIGSTPFFSPFGNNIAVEARVGRIPSGQLAGNWILWKRRDTGACFGTQIGPVTGFNQHTSVVGTSQADLMISQNGTEVINCNGTNIVFETPVTGFRDLNFVAEGGDDAVLAAFPTRRILGGFGRDIVAGAGGIVGQIDIIGGPGDDQVEAHGSAINERLFGEGENDCLWDQNSRNSLSDCGFGFDSLKTSVTVPLGCDNIQPTVCCNFARLIGAC